MLPTGTETVVRPRGRGSPATVTTTTWWLPPIWDCRIFGYRKRDQRRAIWLGDAFASGGSATTTRRWALLPAAREPSPSLLPNSVTTARAKNSTAGYWRYVRRCLRQRPNAPEKNPPGCRLDHRDIFLDPNPDPAFVFLSRSACARTSCRVSWQDYTAS